jgi:NADH:ubiquinone oxidoreductase subunit 6 (subunit J)
MSIYFNILILLIIIQSLCIITSKNTITSILLLINIYIITAICYLIIGAEFLALTLIIVYVGAISILFLFIVMMLNLRIVEVYDTFITYVPIGCFIGFFFSFEIIYLIDKDSTFYTMYPSNFYNDT